LALSFALAALALLCETPLGGGSRRPGGFAGLGDAECTFDERA
jgi:hypothetical protein